MNKKGLTLIELLGLMVIMGILISMSATIIASYVQANRRIAESVEANEEGHLISRRIESSLEDLNPNTYETCGVTNCYIFIKEYEYVINEETQNIELNVLTDPVEYKLEIVNQSLYIDDVLYDFEGFSLGTLSSLNVIEEGLTRSFTFNIILISNRDVSYEFLSSYAFEESVIPNA
jgi:type II secretory pathway pseudopilin PulG